MSEVISFRLDKNNQREAQAFDILEAWCLKGYSVRYVITEALLKLNDPGPELMTNDVLCDLNAALEQINVQLQYIGKSNISPIIGPADVSLQSNLSDSFIASLKKNGKTGFET
jgi:hypothetical protein